MAKGSEPDNIVDIAAAQAARAKSAAQGQGVVDLREIIAAQSEIARAGPDLRRVVDTITDKVLANLDKAFARIPARTPR